MKTKEEEVAVESEGYERRSNTIRVQKHERQRIKSVLIINQSIQGDSIEVMMERIREGEGEEGIPDRDLVYNDNESTTVNPITNIRTDRFESMLEEKIGQYDHQHRKIPRTMEAEKKEEKTEEGKDGTNNTKE